MRTACYTMITILAIATPAVAQREPGGGGRGAGTDRERGGLGMMMPFGQISRRLAMDLALNDSQRPQYDVLVAKYETQAAELRGTGEMPDLFRELRAAREDGDQERASELRAQFRERRTAQHQLVREFFDEVEPLLVADQVERLGGARQRFEERAEMGQRMAEARDLVERLPQELDLSAEQRTQFDALVAAQREQMRQRGPWQEMRTLRDELDQAQTAGEEQRVAELRAELEQRRPEPPNFEEFFSQLEPILTAEQKEKLAALRTEESPPTAKALDLQAVFRAAKRLDLNAQQRDRLKGIMREAQTAYSKGARDRAARGELAQQAKGQIVESLTAEQAAQFERFLAQGDRAAGAPRERGERGARRPAPAKAPDTKSP